MAPAPHTPKYWSMEPGQPFHAGHKMSSPFSALWHSGGAGAGQAAAEGIGGKRIPTDSPQSLKSQHSLGPRPCPILSGKSLLASRRLPTLLQQQAHLLWPCESPAGSKFRFQFSGNLGARVMSQLLGGVQHPGPATSVRMVKESVNWWVPDAQELQGSVSGNVRLSSCCLLFRQERFGSAPQSWGDIHFYRYPVVFVFILELE